jgi:hypothetical protein
LTVLHEIGTLAGVLTFALARSLQALRDSASARLDGDAFAASAAGVRS